MDSDENDDQGLRDEAAPVGRHRLHRSPARGHAIKVLYGDDEWSLVVEAARAAGLRPSSYVATAALAHARCTLLPAEGAGAPAGRTSAGDQELLAELIQARLVLRRYGVNVNQAVAALHSVGRAPVWLEQAVAGAQRAVGRVDEAAGLLVRRLERGQRKVK